MRQIVLDTETTGLSPEAGDRIIEIGCVELLHRKLTGNTFHCYLNPERDIHEDAIKVHGISNEFLQDKPLFSPIVGELYPGKRNSLDALCERLGVSNAARKFHGGLLDAELLADVYIHLTRGQDALLIEGDEQGLDGIAQTRMDYSALPLPVIRASAEEMAAHEKLLDDIDKASGGKTLWRQTSPA
jgi:DNA polymerase-3 subunit epsilon